MIIRKQFMDIDYLTTYSPLERNIDAEKLNPIIFKAQDMYIQPLLGSSFYNHLMLAIENETLTTDEVDLIDEFIKPALCEWTQYVATNFLRTKTTNKSMNQERSDYADVADRNDLKDIKNILRDSAEFYSTRLTTHLCQHNELYPVYENPEDLENLRKTNKTYFSGVSYQGRSNGCCDDGSQYRTNRR